MDNDILVKNNISFENVDNILKKLSLHYKMIKQKFESHIGGSNDKQSKNKKENKYYQKYKKMVKDSIKSINYYKDITQQQIANQWKINNYYQNLIQMFKNQHEKLVYGYRNLNNDFKNESNRIKMLESMISGLEKITKTNRDPDVSVKKIILKGGTMMYDQFENLINTDMNSLKEHIETIDKNKSFIESKISELESKMKNIIEDNENIFKSKVMIDWYVNQLENIQNEPEKDFTQLYQKLKTLIDEAKRKGNPNDQMASMINNLETRAKYLETIFSNSNSNDASTNIPENSTYSLQQYKENEIPTTTNSTYKKYLKKNMTNKYPIIYNQEQNKTNYNKDLLGGAKTLEDKYKELKTLQISKQNDKLDKTFTHIELSNNQSLISEGIDQSKKSSVIHLLDKLEEKMEQFKIFLQLFKKNQRLITSSQEGDYNIRKIWDDAFSKKKTKYYTDILLEKDMFFILGKTKVSQVLESLSNLYDESSEYNKIPIDLSLSIDNLITTIDNTIIGLDHIMFVLETILLSLITLSSMNSSDLNIDQLKKNFEYRKTSLRKSYNVMSYKDFNNILVGGTPIKYSSLFLNTTYIIPQIDEVDLPIYFELIKTMIPKIQEKKDISLVSTNKEQVEKTLQLTGMMSELYDKICLKLGKSISEPTSESTISTIENFTAFNDSITAPTASTATTITSAPVVPTATTVATIASAPVVAQGTLTKPRMDPFKKKLQVCFDTLTPYKEKIDVLKSLLMKYKEGQFSIDETKSLVKLYSTVKKQIEEGINSYIKLIPMIFFTIEFPPVIYKDTECKYQFTFKGETVTYSFKDANETKSTCNNLGLGNFKDPEDFKDTLFTSHAGFFESNKLNGTKKLIEDPVIGLKKLIEPDSDVSKPINKTINMMFALGASGTGKTTRYFGKSGNNPDDVEGIVPYIIKESTAGDSGKEVSIAYFVCYGRKKIINSSNHDFDELVLFFDLNTIFSSSSGDRYIPYTMVQETPQSNIAQKYTQFYSAVVNKNLVRRTFSEMENFISKGAEFPANSASSNSPGTFRDLLEKGPKELWYNIKDKSSQEISDIFENLIIEQKKISTVMPTKNNIESSRGHTCVLVKIKDTSSGDTKYFPLFDMAGTENTEGISEFLNNGRNINNMAKLVQKVNLITQTNDITNSENKNYPSLNDLLKYENIENWVNMKTNKKYITIESHGGAEKTKLPVDNFYTGILENNADTSPGQNYLDKVVKEGYYINHTIAMLIFAAMCVGYSLRTEKDSSGDKFDDFLSNVFADIQKFTCIPSTSGNSECTNKTMMLLSSMNVNVILNSSCIWLQVLFSFLYWNEETDESIEKLVQEFDPENQESINYLCEPKVQEYEIIPDLMTIGDIIEVGKIDKDAVKQEVKYLLDSMNAINATHDILFAEGINKSTITKPVEFVEFNDTNNENLQIYAIQDSTKEKISNLETNSEIQGLTVKWDNIKIEENFKKLRQLLTKINLVVEKWSDANSTRSNKNDFIIFTENNSLYCVSLSKKSSSIIVDNIKIGNKNINSGNMEIEEAKKIQNDIMKVLAEYNKRNLRQQIGEKRLTYVDDINHTLSGEIPLITKILREVQQKFDNKYMYQEKNCEIKLQLIEKESNYFDLLITTNYNSGIIGDNGKIIKFHDTNWYEIHEDSDMGQIYITIPLDEIIDVFSKFSRVSNTSTCEKKTITDNQMKRVQDGKISATKMTLMHLVTGQGIKHHMVQETIGLCTTLYNATNLDLSNKKK